MTILNQKLVSEIKEFLKIWNPTLVKEGNNTIIEVENKLGNQTLIVQLTENENIWVRLQEPHSGCFCQSLDEFKIFTKQLLNNSIEIAIVYKKLEWVETIIIDKDNYSDLKSEYKYVIATWVIA